MVEVLETSNFRLSKKTALRSTTYINWNPPCRGLHNHPDGSSWHHRTLEWTLCYATETGVHCCRRFPGICPISSPSTLDESTTISCGVWESNEENATKKFPGPDNISYKLIQHGVLPLKSGLFSLILRMWESEQVPKISKTPLLSPSSRKAIEKLVETIVAFLFSRSW